MRLALIFPALLAGTLLFRLPQEQVPEKGAQKIDFVRDIQPIFKASCYECHGPKKQKGKFRLDSKESAFKPADSGQSPIVPGKSKESRLYQLLIEPKEDDRMPQKGDPLPKEQIELIRAWIDAGAEWPDGASAKLEKHWAYVKPIRPEPPVVKDAAWARNPIDAFILARLEKEGLKPSPEASRETLLRRVSLDLTGLPPTAEEADAFLADASPDAYEKIVDRLLASPHYGERWARPWLDLARYADTNGHEKDVRRVMWKYRDWVISALNKDMPFDQFTIEQIAGDMLPNATVDQRVATGFHRNTMLNQEGGVDPEEAYWETLVDRVNTTAFVWLGSTIACAQCHNHKYDPFAQKDYYGLLAFFEGAQVEFRKISTLDRRYFEPEIELPTPEQEAKAAPIRTEIARLEAFLKSKESELEADLNRWEDELRAADSGWKVLNPRVYASAGGATLTPLGDGSLFLSGANPDKDTLTFVADTDLKGITAFMIEALSDSRLHGSGPGRSSQGYFVLSEIRIQAGSEGIGLKNAVATYQQEGFPVAHAIDGKPETGWGIWRQNASPHAAIFEAAPTPGPATLTFILDHQSSLPQHVIGRVRLSATAGKPVSPRMLPHRIRVLFDIPREARSKEAKEELHSYFSQAVTTLHKPERDRLTELRKNLEKIGIPTAWVMAEKPSHERPSTWLRRKGSFTDKAEKIYSGVPPFLHPLPESELPNRLGLARWLVDPSQPLTARVAVNRFWEQFFGRGIVETSEDFGIQGARPTHPELLDWLATEFMRLGWSMKAIHKTIVMSATYRQSSGMTSALIERDPYNRLLARGPRFRMEAEMLRDTMLAASGLLSRKIGGPSVFPYQPEGVWVIAASGDKWQMSEGEDRHRRSLYTFWRRTAPYPSYMTFDAPSREFCTVRRPRTNTPLQSLTLLNDPAYFEMARALGTRLLEEGAGACDRAAFGFRQCTARRPEPEELERLLKLYEKQLERFGKDAAAARALLKGSVPPNEADLPAQAAWTVVANVLLNLDETVTKE